MSKRPSNWLEREEMKQTRVLEVGRKEAGVEDVLVTERIVCPNSAWFTWR